MILYAAAEAAEWECAFDTPVDELNDSLLTNDVRIL